MIWAHEIVHYLSMGHFNMLVFSVGIILSISVSILLLRQQLLVDDKQWLRRMIPHHSTALTTTTKLLEKNGFLIIAVPNINSFDSKYYKEKWAALDVPRHLWHFTRNGIESLLKNKDFILIKSYQTKSN